MAQQRSPIFLHQKYEVPFLGMFCECRMRALRFLDSGSTGPSHLLLVNGGILLVSARDAVDLARPRIR